MSKLAHSNDETMAKIEMDRVTEHWKLGNLSYEEYVEFRRNYFREWVLREPATPPDEPVA